MTSPRPTPRRPALIGSFAEDGYTHDAQIVNYERSQMPTHVGKEICLVLSTKTQWPSWMSPIATDAILLSNSGYAASDYTHQGWLTEDSAVPLGQ